MASNAYNLNDMMKEPLPDASGMHLGIVVSQWNNNITQDLLNGAIQTLKENGVKDENILVKCVPGSFELIFGCQQLINTQKVDAIIAIGCVIRGDTPHFEYINNAVSQGIMELNLHGDVPVVFGLLTTNNLQQAEERSGGILGNKGSEYAVTAIRMIDYVWSIRR